MVWYKRLYTGSLIRRKAEEVKEKIDGENYPPGVWLVALPVRENALLELMPAGQLVNPYVRDGIHMIAGLALGRSEASYLAQKIVQDCLDAGKDTDIRSFLLEKDRG